MVLSVPDFSKRQVEYTGMNTQNPWKTAAFNAALLALAVLPFSLAIGSLADDALIQGPATVAQVLEGAAFAFLVLVLPYALLSAVHSAVMHLLRRYSERQPRLFVASSWLAVLALPIVAEIMRTDQRSGRYDLANLLAIAAYCVLARIPK